MDEELKRALVIFTKVPIPGLVKTRLAQALTSEGAAALYRSFLLDTIDLANSVSGCETIMAYTPREASQVLQDMVKQPIKLVPQSNGDLGGRMNNVFKDLFAQGYESALLIGADLPTLPVSHLRAAFTLLEHKPVALGPSQDGGYYLIGLRAPQPELFKGIAWGTDQVLGQTVERINCLGLEAGCLAPWYDVDTVDNLDFLVSHLRLLMASGKPDLPHTTVDTLHRLGLLKNPWHSCSKMCTTNEGVLYLVRSSRSSKR